MNKFKVGDEVGNEHVKYLGEVIKVINDELVKVIVFDGVISVYDSNYLIKTPHQELLDLGWEETFDNGNFVKYEIEDDGIIFTLGIDKHLKEYAIDTKQQHLSSFYLYQVNLELAKLLVRYLEDLK